MSVYKVGLGHNVAEISLTTIRPQPRTTGIQTVERSVSISGQVYEHAEYVVFNFDFSESPTDYQSLLTLFGLDDSLTEEVTVYIRSWDFSWVRKNGLAVRPEVGRDVAWQNFFPRGIEILIKNLSTAV